MRQVEEGDLQAIAERIIDGTKKRSISDARVTVSRSRSVSVTYRQQKADKVQESIRQNLAVHLYDHGKYSTSETNDLRPQAMEHFLDSAAVLCKAMAVDPYRSITDPTLYEDCPRIDLQIFDSSIHEVRQTARHDCAAALEAETISAAGTQVISVEATYEDSIGEAVQLHSNGFEGARIGSQFWTAAKVTLGDRENKRPAGWAETGARFLKQLDEPGRVGQLAANNAKARLGAIKMETGRMTMIVENRVCSRLLGQLLAAISGRALQQKASFLEGRLDGEVGSALLNLTDDPLILGGFGSRLFDSEGISATKRNIFEKGVLRHYYLDTYYGKKLGMKPTTGSRSNLVLTPGTKSLPELVAGVSRGVLVRGFLGGNSNPTTGDFSLGVHGTLIENGQLGPAVAEANISGCHKELWSNLVEVGNDPYRPSSLLVPSLVFDGVQFAGA